MKHKKEKKWLSNVSSVAPQQKLRDLDQAFDNFFDGRAGYPNFNPNFKRKHGKQAARFASNAFTLTEGSTLRAGRGEVKQPFRNVAGVDR